MRSKLKRDENPVKKTAEKLIHLRSQVIHTPGPLLGLIVIQPIGPPQSEAPAQQRHPP